MNLGEIREEFVNQSGRLDLINPDGSDNGADFYLKSGQDYLDLIFEKHEDEGRVFRVINSGDYFVKFHKTGKIRARAIHEVGIGDTEKFHWIEKKDLRELRSQFNKPFEYIEKAKPGYFSTAYIRPAYDEQESIDGFVGYMDAMTGHKDYDGIILLPPSDGEYHVEIWGKFFSEILREETDTSFWSVNHPALLIMSAQRELEIFYRNSQGIADWTSAIRAETLELERDHVEQVYYGFNKMEG